MCGRIAAVPAGFSSETPLMKRRVWQAKLNRPSLQDKSITWKLAQAHFHWCGGDL